MCFQQAHEYFERGMNIIPIAYRSKMPPKGFDLRSRFSRRCTADEIRLWFGGTKKHNIGIITGTTSGLVVVDADTVDAARRLYHLLPKTSMMTRTANGVHFFYRIATDQVVKPRVKTIVMGIEADIRGDNSYVVAAPSVHPSNAKKQYKRLGRWELVDVPFFQPDWLDEKQRPSSSVSSLQRDVRDAVAYIQNIEAVSGQGGHRATFRATCILRDAGFTPEEALAALVDWNLCGHADPPWSTKELLHKVTSSYRSKPC